MFESRIITGDNLEILPTLPAEVVDLVVTSPPYPGQYGDGRTVPEWLEWMGEVIRQTVRVMRPNGVMAFNVDFKRDERGFRDLRLSTSVPLLFAQNGLNCIDEYAYIKPNPAPNGPIRRVDIPAWEHVFVLTKAPTMDDYHFQPVYAPYKPKSVAKNGAIYSTRLHNGKTAGGATIRPNPKGARQRNVIEASSSGDQGRPKAAGVSFPLWLPKRFILQYTKVGDLVMDMFAGVGTTCRAAKELNRRWLGIEILPEEADKAREWVGESVQIQFV